MVERAIDDRLDFRILGPLEVSGPSGAIELSAPKHRALLLLLVLHRNEVVSFDAAIEALWPAPPATARKLLQQYISQLRRSLGADRIETAAGGYSLRVKPDELDAARFERLLAEAGRAHADGNPARARTSAESALRLWRGAALADVAYEDFARPEAERLEELRLDAFEERIEADLALGPTDDVVGDLRALAREHPLRERLAAQLMIALYRSGRQSQALNAYAETRGRLRDELGLEPGPELRALQRAILAQDPALEAPGRDAGRRRGVPAPVGPLLGREPALDELSALLRREETRLVTLTGAGGSGKTQLALELARRLAPEFANGAAFVELASLRESSLVPAAIASSLAPGADGAATPELLLESEELLLVLDNAEHLPEAWPGFVALLAAAPYVKLVVTSRAVLHLSGERVYPVPPLEPEPAVELFLARAEAAGATPEADPSREAVADICARVDNLPLAIELAAPRLRTMSLATLAERMAQRLPLLTRGARDLPARQQTLRSTIEWSVGLLEPQERRLLAQLSVFDGGFTVDAVEQVCDGTLDELTALLDASLVRPTSGGTRFELLETIREFAQERLEGAETRRRHAEHFLAVAEAASLSAETDLRAQHEVAIEEQENLRAAISWATTEAPELALCLCLAIEQFWASSAPAEGLRRLTALMPVSEGLSPRLRMRALRVFGGMTQLTGGDLDVVERAQREALAIAEALGDERAQATLFHRIAVALQLKREHDEARRLARRSLELHRRTGSAMGETQALRVLAACDWEQGDRVPARALFEQSLAIARETGFTWWKVGVLNELAHLLCEEGLSTKAEQNATEALEDALEIGYRRGAMLALATLAVVAHRDGDAERAGTIWGAVEAERARTPMATWSRTAAAALTRPLEQDTSPGFATARVAGGALTLAAAARVALGD